MDAKALQDDLQSLGFTPRKSFVTLINHASAPIRKVRLSPTSKARREASQNEFMVKGRLRKVQNLI